jgi:exopolyphosphatase/guanosine-5'-triphosphate,3'-diphosphate pyrophosphatase
MINESTPVKLIRRAVAEISDGQTIAAVDLGSNSFHLMVARESGGNLHVMDRLREPVRLGAGLDADCNLDPDTMERALACLERFGQRLAGMSPAQVRAVGTNALRQARNSRAFLQDARKALGHSIDIVSGYEEARLIYAGVAHSLATDGRQRLVIDIGGSSTELILGRDRDPELIESLHMGCVSYTTRFFRKGVASTKAMRKAQLHARQQMEVIATEFREHGWDDAVGASGTLRSLGNLCETIGGSDQGITLASLRKVETKLVEVGNFDDFTLLGLTEDRAEVVAAGLCVLLAVIEALDISRIRVADGAIREGLLLDLVGRRARNDVREKTVVGLEQRYQLDTRHGTRVAALAEALFLQCADRWQLHNPLSLAILRWAARLCEIGLGISHSSFHKHGGYILGNADLAGFSRQEQQLLAALVRLHRRRFRKEIMAGLVEPWDQAGVRLAVILRLAVLLNRSRSLKSLPAIAFRGKPDKPELEFPAGWLDERPLTLADLKDEADYLAAGGIRFRFR